MSRQQSRFGIAAAAAVLVLAAGPGLAQDARVPCSAFSRDAGGGWHVRSPVAFGLGGIVLAPTVGTIFAAGKTMHGIDLGAVLDLACVR